jgi:hypothetical protein
MRGNLRGDRLVRRQVDAERLFAQKVLSRLQASDVDLLVEVVRDGAIHRVDRVVREQLAVVGDEPRRRVEPLVPPEHLRIHVADNRELGPGPEDVEVHPPGRRARELPTHEAAAHEPEANDPVRHWA